jgi:hypothetical protein
MHAIDTSVGPYPLYKLARAPTFSTAAAVIASPPISTQLVPAGTGMALITDGTSSRQLTVIVVDINAKELGSSAQVEPRQPTLMKRPKWQTSNV